jgi:hypothetical protein
VSLTEVIVNYAKWVSQKKSAEFEVECKRKEGYSGDVVRGNAFIYGE